MKAERGKEEEGKILKKQKIRNQTEYMYK